MVGVGDPGPFIATVFPPQPLAQSTAWLMPGSPVGPTTAWKERKGRGALPSQVLTASLGSFLLAQRLFWTQGGRLQVSLVTPDSPTRTLLWGGRGELGAALTLCSSAASSAQNWDVSLGLPQPPSLHPVGL